MSAVSQGDIETSCELRPGRKGCRAAKAWLDGSLDLPEALDLSGQTPRMLHRIVQNDTVL